MLLVIGLEGIFRQKNRRTKRFLTYLDPMRTYLWLISCLALGFTASAQEITWSEDIAPLVFDNCSKCHHEGSAAHFSLMSYNDFVEHSLGINYAILDGEMPPWPADPEYRHFIGETVLTPEEKQMIIDFIEGSMPYGDPDLEPDPPVYIEGGSLLESVDFVAAIEPYTVQSNAEEYRWFVIPTNFNETKYIQAVEVKAGLSEAVHHADIHVDVTGQTSQLDAADPLPGFNNQTGWPTTTTYINAWQPGAGPARYPDDWGIALPPGADLVIEIHYGYGFAGEVDETYMNLEFVDNVEDVRPVSVGWLMGSGHMTDGPLVIPPNQISTFHQESTPFSTPKSILAICPHMHLLGKSYNVWMETQQGDSIPLIDIPDWDFRWQFYYNFPSPQIFPGGTTLKSIGQYDNTVNNPHNPNFPPITVTDGALTTDEMFLCYFIYADYQPGDEDIIIDPGTNTSVAEVNRNLQLKVYPNPASNFIQLDWEGNGPALVEVYNSKGKRVLTTTANGNAPISIEVLPSGVYNVVLQGEDGRRSASFVRR